jgi:hypothetical protein
VTTQLPDPQAPLPEPEAQTLTLRPSPELSQVPEPASTQPEAKGIPEQAAPVAAQAPAEADTQHSELLPEALRSNGWAIGSVALLAALGWLVRRRRHRARNTEDDSDLWANVSQRTGSPITSVGGLDQIVPDSRDPVSAAGSIYLTAIGETTSRREATLSDLHQLAGKFWRRHERGDTMAAVVLLQQHLVDFRYTSPWVFLELRELYKVLALQQEWEVAREVFRSRFGQEAPEWAAPSTAPQELTDDPQLCKDLARGWPHRMARMFILRWMLGVHEMRQKATGPPLLGLGVYRDLMMLDALLDEVMASV